MKILFAGRFNYEKGVTYLVEAAKQLKSEDFYLVGYGPLEEQLKKEAENAKNIHFMGPMRHDKLMSYMKKFDIFIYPSLAEGLGFSVVEFCHLGKPAIVTSVGGLPETIGNGKGGIVIEPKSSEEIVSAIKKLKNAKLRKSLGASAKKYVGLEFNKDYWISEFKKHAGNSVLYIDIAKEVDYLRTQNKIIRDNTKKHAIIVKGNTENRLIYMFKVFFRGYKILRNNKDMNIISCKTDYIAPPAILLGKIFRRKVYGELFTFPVEYEEIRGTSKIKLWLLEKFLKVFTPKFDEIWVCSRALGKEAKKYGAKKIIYLPYWLDF